MEFAVTRRARPADDSYATPTAWEFLIAMTDRSELLNTAQRNHFAVLLAMMEESLADIETLADPVAARDGRLTVRVDDLPPAFTDSVRPLLADFRREVTALAERLGIPPRHASRARSIRAIVTSEVVRIEDSVAARLRGYGAVHPDAASVIGPVLERLHSGFLAIGALLYSGLPDARPPADGGGAPPIITPHP